MKYPDGMTLRPLMNWPGKHTGMRRPAPFRSSFTDTVELLDRELRHLGPAYSRRPAPSILQIALREQDFRIDGMPRANAVPSMPGVILNIESRHGPLSYPCDRFDRWQDNLRAVALGLEALRKIDRYGITPGSEQYTGWKALPPPSPVNGKMTVEVAEQLLRDVVAEHQGHGLDLGTLQQVYRRARASTHPDRGGDRAVWDQVEAAAGVLRAAGAL